ncbi:MAG TPA: hypothetical protein VI479_16540 [Blastocatellia bacterium]
MINLDALDTLIAVVVALLVLSLIVQSIQAAIKKFFHIKSLQLEQSLIHLFYYLLDKDAIKDMRTVSDRTPLLRAFFSGVNKLIRSYSKPLPALDPQVGDLYQAVIEEFVRAGRVTSRGKALIDSVSKDELIRFIGLAPVSKLIEHIPLPERENILEIREKIAAARKAVKELIIEHRELIEQTPLAEIRQPLLEMLSGANKFLDLKNSDLTLGDLSAEALGAARKTLDALPDSIEETLLHLKDEAGAEAAQALRRLQKELAPLSNDLKAVIELPQKLSQILVRIEIWYDTIMQSFDERYTRSMKSFSLAISFAVVALLNANLFDIYREISASESKRDLMVQSGEQIASRLREQPPADNQQIAQTLQDWSKKSYEEIDQNVSLYTALGFSGPRWIVDVWKNPRWPTAQKIFETVAGWLITTMLLSVGAPFWQDALGSLFGLKNYLRKKDQATT